MQNESASAIESGSQLKRARLWLSAEGAQSQHLCDPTDHRMCPANVPAILFFFLFFFLLLLLISLHGALSLSLPVTVYIVCLPQLLID